MSDRRARFLFGGSSRLSALLLVLALVLAACGGDDAEEAEAGGDGDAETAMSTEEICEAGAEEGGFTHWHNHSNMDEVYAAFNEEYPDIEIEGLEMTPDEAAQRALTEYSAGQGVSVDLMAGGVDIFTAVIDEGMVDTEIDWTEHGVAEDLVHESNTVRIHRVAMGLVYNTENNSAEDLPDTWDELIDEQWEGSVIVDPRGRPFDQLSLLWGEDEAMSYVEELREVVNPLVIEGGTAGMVAVAGGEAEITTGGRSAETLEQQAEGAPLEIKYMEAIPTIDNYNLVLADAENLNAARCYSIWFSAGGGQEVYNEVEFKSNETVPADAPEGAEIITVESPEDAQAVSDLGSEMGRIWTGQ